MKVRIAPAVNSNRTAKIVESESKGNPHMKGNRFMRYGRYESSDGSSYVGTALTFLLIGLGAGALVGMLYAPKPGKQMRKELRRRYEDARETFDDWREQARDVAEEAIERGAELAEEVRERVTPLTRNLRRG
jgi:gas vesicle protein